MQHDVGFCSCFPYFEAEFNTNSLLHYRFHIQHDKTTTYSITKPVIKEHLIYLEQNGLCVANGSRCKVTRTAPNITKALLIYRQISGPFWTHHIRVQNTFTG
jgi:hypothetical protein